MISTPCTICGYVSPKNVVVNLLIADHRHPLCGSLICAFKLGQRFPEPAPPKPSNAKSRRRNK